MSKGDYTAIILGAGKPHVGLAPSGLRRVDNQNSVLDWQIHSLQSCCSDFQFIGGYEMQKVAKHHPEMTCILNEDWEKTGSISSLLKARFRKETSYVISYGDILYWEEDLHDLTASEDSVVFAVDNLNPLTSHVAERTDLETIQIEKSILGFVGIIYVPQGLRAVFTEVLKDGFATGCKDHLSALIQHLDSKGVPTKIYDITGKWSDLNSPSDLTRFVIGTKAETLARLETRIKKASIPPQVRFQRSEYTHSADEVIERVLERFDKALLAVRSSALTEDGFLLANAGAYHSELNVPPYSANLQASIDAVLASIPDDHSEDQVFVQPMVQGVIASGVLFTRIPQSGAPYYRINYDLGHDTASVTSGTSQDTASTVILKSEYGAKSASELPQEWMKGLIDAVQEIENIVGIDYLDIEFAINEQLDVFILQVRPLVLGSETSDDFDYQINQRVLNAQKRFASLQSATPNTANTAHAFGVMPDWNPAEIIGTYPAVLSASLYAYLIMDDVWAQQRAEFGYKDVRPAPLMRLFCGQPYVDIKASLTSFVPAALSNNIALRLLEFSIEKLRKNPDLHDKIEFEIIPTCCDFNFSRWRSELGEAGFTEAELSEIEGALKTITAQAFSRISKDCEEMSTVQARYEDFAKHGFSTPLDKAISLLEQCKAAGTINFSHLARQGFIAISLLRSAAEVGLLSDARVQEFLASVKTVSGQYQEDAYLVRNDSMSFDVFKKKYGHLRPGTYDSLSRRYDEDVEFYLQHAVDNARAPEASSFTWTQEEQNSLEDAIKTLGLNVSFDDFDSFCRRGISGREESKFIFTRFLSDAIQSLVAQGNDLGLSTEEISNIPLSAWRNYSNGLAAPNDPGDYFKTCAQFYEREMHYNRGVCLPPLLFKESDMSCFTAHTQSANFISKKRVLTELINLNIYGDQSNNLSGKIVLIEAADPGYDWLFGHGIAGIITKYGGANSHMAIRAAEFSLPAAIGVGSTKYQTLSGAKKIDLNCETQQITVVGL